MYVLTEKISTADIKYAVGVGAGIVKIATYIISILGGVVGTTVGKLIDAISAVGITATAILEHNYDYVVVEIYSKKVESYKNGQKYYYNVEYVEHIYLQ